MVMTGEVEVLMMKESLSEGDEPTKSELETKEEANEGNENLTDENTRKSGGLI
jgi:hypothetical protein